MFYEKRKSIREKSFLPIWRYLARAKDVNPTGPGPEVIWLTMAVLRRSIPFLAVADCVRQEKRPHPIFLFLLR